LPADPPGLRRPRPVRRGCPFRTDSLSANCRDDGAPPEKIADVASFRKSDRFTAAEAAALGLAEAMSRTPADVTDAEFDEARRHFNDQQLVELAATIASENYRARFNRAVGVESLGLYS
jgi:alkylhydroperoxidase family enzyme